MVKQKQCNLNFKQLENDLRYNCVWLCYSNNINRVIPPRKYCDICEVFDLHETEDCPVQMTDTDVAVRDVSGNRVLPEQRPYCDICEGSYCSYLIQWNLA